MLWRDVGNIPAQVSAMGIVHYHINANDIFLYQRLSVHYVEQYKANVPTDISATVECSKYSAASLCHWLLIRASCMIIIYCISLPITVYLQCS